MARKGKPRKTDYYIEMKPEELGKIRGVSELRKITTALKKEYNRRVREIESSGLYSYALDAYERNMVSTDNMRLSDKTRNQLLNSIFRYQSFLRSTTSTLEGVLATNIAQDKMLFGVDASGQLRGTLGTQEERAAFWDLYEEYKAQYKEGVQKYLSGKILRALASATVGKGVSSSDIINGDISGFLNKLEKQLEKDAIRENLSEARISRYREKYDMPQESIVITKPSKKERKRNVVKRRTNKAAKKTRKRRKRK